MDDQGENRARAMTRKSGGTVAITTAIVVGVVVIALGALGMYWSRDPEAFDVEKTNLWLRKLKWPRVTEAQLRKVIMARLTAHD